MTTRRRQGQNRPTGTNARGTYKNALVQGRVITLAAQGKSQRSISYTMGIHRGTVARILSQREIAERRDEARSLILDSIPKVAKKAVQLALKGAGDGQRAIDLLRGVQVLTPREEHAFAQPADFGEAGRTYEEITFFLQFRRAPKDKEELESWAKEHPLPVELPAHLCE